MKRIKNLIYSAVLLVQEKAPDFEPVPGDNKGLIKIPVIFKGQAGPAGRQSFGELVVVTLQILLLIVGSLAVIYLMYGGFRYITSSGNEEQTEAAKKTITNAILGLVIVILSFALITIIARLLITGSP